MVVDTFSCDLFFLFIKNITQRKKFRNIEKKSKFNNFFPIYYRR